MLTNSKKNILTHTGESSPWNREYRLQRILPLFFIILILFTTFFIRLMLLFHDLPYYSIDENDVVEPALAYLGGDWEPYWYQYGPLFSYILALIFKAVKGVTELILGWTTEDFFYAAFFRQSVFFILARAFHAVTIFGIVAVSWVFARKHYDHQTEIAVIMLSAVPILDLITGFTVRVDTLQGFLGLLSIYLATCFKKNKGRLYFYAAAGIIAGLNISTKPLPGLLLIPTLVLAYFLSIRENTSSDKIGHKLISHPGLWVMTGAIILSHSLVHPYSIIKFSDFLNQQIITVTSKAAQGGTRAGYDFRWLIPVWGWPLTVAAGATLLIAWRWLDDASRLLLSYVVVFCGVFLFFDTRIYFYNAVIPALILLIARLISNLSNLRSSVAPKYASAIVVLLSTILIAHPLYRSSTLAWNDFTSPTPSVENRSERASQHWIETHIPSHSPVLLVGGFSSSLPRIVADTESAQARWGEYFMYQRYRNEPWRQAFQMSYQQLKKTQQPRFRISNIRLNYSNQHSEKTVVTLQSIIHLLPNTIRHYVDAHPGMNLNTLFHCYLDEFAMENGFRYLITASPDGFNGKWEQNENVHLLQIFNRNSGHRGNEVKVFEIVPKGSIQVETPC